MSLRLRLGLSAAAAVAIAVSAVAAAAWLMTRHQFSDQLNSNLRSVQASPRYINQLLQSCDVDQSRSPDFSEKPTQYVVQVVMSDGTVCADPGGVKYSITAADVAVAAGELDSVIHDTESQDGTKMRVSTERVPGAPSDIAISIAQPLSGVDTPLKRLALYLLGISGVGIVGAATSGVAISRAGLRPVVRLTDAAEQIARTQNLKIRLPVAGSDEIARMSRSFNVMTEALSVSFERQRQLVADAGHELRTPLTSLRANVQLLARSQRSGRKLPDGVLVELLDSIEAQVGELAELISDLQVLSRADSGSYGDNVSLVPLHEIAERALARVKLRGPEVDFEHDLQDWYLWCDPAALERALVNLLDNAVKFSPPGGSVSMNLNSGVLVIRDRGVGVNPRDLPHVFERFWRSPAARSLPGSGLGLAIVDRAVRQAGGTVELRAASEVGTEAIVRLPGCEVPPPSSKPRASEKF